MECRSCIDALTALMDGELGGPERQRVEGHLDSCIKCSGEFESLRYSYQLVNSIPDVDLGPDLWDSIRPQLPKRSLLPDLGFLLVGRPWVPAAAGLVVIFAVVSAFLIVPSGDPLEEDFATFMQERERIAVENTTILFGDTQFDRYQPRRNPFIQQLSSSKRNPFQE